MMIQAADLLATTKNPSEDQIRTAMNGHLCRCGTISENPDRDPEGRGRDGKGRCVMTGLIPEKEFSRKSFMKHGGALMIGFSLVGTSLTAGKAQAVVGAPDIAGPPDPTQVDSWIAVHPDNTVSVFMGKVPNGTGTDTGTRIIAAEELSLAVDQVPDRELRLCRAQSGS